MQNNRNIPHQTTLKIILKYNQINILLILHRSPPQVSRNQSVRGVALGFHVDDLNWDRNSSCTNLGKGGASGKEFSY